MRGPRKPSANAPLPRHEVVWRLRRRLLQSSYPRLQMMLLVALTAGAGLLASWWMWRSGLTAMGLRYPAAVAIAYWVFLGLLWLWMRTRWADYCEHIDPLDFVPSKSSRAHADALPQSDSASLFDAAGGSGSGGGDGASVLDAVVGADEAVIPLAVLAVLVAVCAALLLALGSVVWSAPALFAEILFDGVLAVGLYRRLRRGDSQHWLQTAFRHTVWPFALVLAFSAIAGGVLQWYAPEATTLGQALDHRDAAPTEDSRDNKPH